jgi:hypothetical protein
MDSFKHSFKVITFSGGPCENSSAGDEMNTIPAKRFLSFMGIRFSSRRKTIPHHFNRKIILAE